MNLTALTADVRAQASQLAFIGHTLKFDLDDIGVIWVDARESPPVVSNEDLEADCTLYFSERALKEVMVDQTMSPVLAVTLGEISVEGSKAVGERFLALMPTEEDDEA